MTSDTFFNPTRTWSTGLIPAVLLIGGVINGFAVRIADSIRISGIENILFGISPFELIALAVASHLLWHSASDARHKLGWQECLALSAFLLPSSTIAWAGVTAYAFYIASQTHDDRRVGALLFAALGLTALWSSLFIKWFAAPITTVEAHLIVSFLAPLRSDISVSSNLMGVIGGHQVLLLAACSSAYLIPKAMVALAAIAVFMGTRIEGRRFVKVALGTALCLLLANCLRLAIMTWSYDLYLLGHGPVGANAFDLFQTLIIFAAGIWAAK